jgi:hypothetical protein
LVRFRFGFDSPGVFNAGGCREREIADTQK